MATTPCILRVAPSTVTRTLSSPLPHPRSFSSSPRPLLRRRKLLNHYRRIPTSTKSSPDPFTPSSRSDPAPEEYWSSRMQMPAINFYEQDENMTGPRVLIDKLRTWDDVKRKRQEAEREQMEIKALMGVLEQVWTGSSAELPEEANTRLRNRVLAVEADPELKREMRKLRVEREGSDNRYRWDEEAEKDGLRAILEGKEVEVKERAGDEYWDTEEGSSLAGERVRTLNSVLKLAFLGANKFVAQQLWKAYWSVRDIPGVLEGIPAEAWDLIYYSQWALKKSHPNRQTHLQMLERDLASVGFDGPPTKNVEDLKEEDEAWEDAEDMKMPEELAREPKAKMPQPTAATRSRTRRKGRPVGSTVAAPRF